MPRAFLLIGVLGTAFAFGEIRNNVQQSTENLASRNLPSQGVPTLKIDRQGNTTAYLTLDSTDRVPLTEELLSTITRNLQQRAVEVACRAPKGVAPVSVEITLGFLTLRWDRDELCGKK